jgi:hypothetical protein
VPAAIAAGGVDTWSPCWYLTDDQAEVIAPRFTQSGPRGRLMPEAIAGHRVGLMAGRLLYAEGHPVGDRLARADELHGAFDALVEQLLEQDVPVTRNSSQEGGMLCGRPVGFAGVRRCDTTLDVAVTSSAEGLAILAGVAGVLRDGRGKSEVFYGVDGAVETVYLLSPSGRKKLGRWYDKSREQRTGRAELLRPEAQGRWPRESRRDVDDLVRQGYLRSIFHRRFGDLYRASKGVVVAGPMVIAHKIHEMVEAGEITMAQAERVTGYCVLAAIAGRDAGHSRSTSYRRRAEVRELGLVLADGALAEVEIDLHEVLTECMDTDVWDVHGG